eukprot:Anaeramoba_flamelloidesa326989_73.p3 GENE.a326989_73~~a326989_73.p3  ORF type:complete len:143 (+),score=12.51 a326989_73:152-580(+)
MKIVALLLLSLICLNANIKRDHKKQIVYDFTNKLVWQDTKDNIIKMVSQPDAIKYCEELVHAGYSNWRIPHGDDFKTIVDKNNKKNYIKKEFKYIINDGYWAKTVHWRTFWFYADYMHFLSGTLYYDNKQKEKHVRCVRDLK